MDNKEKATIEQEQEPVHNGGITAEQIELWRAKHRKVYQIDVDDDGEVFTAYFRRPDNETLAATTSLAQRDPYKAMSVLFENCWLGGDPLIKDDAVLRMAATQKLDGLVASVVANLKNLSGLTR